MKVIILGASGQLGTELQETAPHDIDVKAFTSSEVDITNAMELESVFDQETPQLVINAAAYTKVDHAESETELAFNVNGTGVKNLACCCRASGVGLIHVSTDFIFDGSANQAITPEMPPNPINVYGKSKLLGEHGINDSGLDHYVIIRTSWVYSQYGKNFVKSMLKLMRSKDRLSVVNDQIGCPTSAFGLATAIWSLASNWVDGEKFDRSISGSIYHWSDLGVASWYDFAYEIQQQGLALGLLINEIPLYPIPSIEFPTQAERPRFSLLDSRKLREKLVLEGRHWKFELSQVMSQLAGASVESQ